MVSDQGSGFDPHSISRVGDSRGGFGLCSIRERLELSGGQFELESAPGKGSRCLLSVPLPLPETLRPRSKEASMGPAACLEPGEQLRPDA